MWLDASPGLHLTIRQPGVGRSGKLDSSEKMTLLRSSVVQSWFFANLSLALFCFSLNMGFFLDLTWALPLGSLFQTVVSMHFNPAAICLFFGSLNVMLWLLSDIQISGLLSRSVESCFHSLPVCSFVVPNVCGLTLFLWTAVSNILRVEATWCSLFPFVSIAGI